jgi:hypothetical protein
MSRMMTLAALNSTYNSASSIRTSQDLDILPQNDQVYLDKDMATDRNVRRMNRHREAALKAPYAGDDILSFSRLTRVTTIGGGGVCGENGRTPRRYRNSANTMGSATFHNTTNTKKNSMTPSGPSTGTTGPNNEKRRSFGESLLLFIQGGHWNSATSEERYQTRFRYPRLAYLIHRIIRVMYVPKKARLPPIPDPFARRSRGGSRGVGDLYERPIARESLPTVMMTDVTVQRPGAAFCQDINEVSEAARPSSEYAGLGLGYTRPRSDDSDDYGEYEDIDDDPVQASCSTSPPRGRSRP